MKRLLAPALLVMSVLCSVAFAQPANNPGTSAPAPAQMTQQAPPSQPRPDNNLPARPDSAVKLDNWNCTLLAAEYDLWRFEVRVTTLSTYRLQNCPASSMDKITSASAAAQLRTVSSFTTIIKGGAHQQIMDINLTPISSEYFWVSNLRFSVLGQARISLKQLFDTTRLKNTKNLAGASYVPFRLYGETHYIWNTGSLVHRLVSPKGDTYLMTSFTQEVQPALTRDKLSSLDTLLRLPPGWKFENYFLDRTIVVRAGVENNNSVEVLFDDLNNNYVQYD